MYANPADELEVSIESGKEGGLFVEFRAGAGRDAVEGVGDGEDVEIEAAGGDADGFVLAAEGEEGVIHGVVVGVCGAEVGCCELRWTERRRRCDAIWVGVWGSEAHDLWRYQHVPSIGGCSRGSALRSRRTSSRS